jgi:acyl-coenzyme A synthetase/AMP-(fatty) acid ligase/acyl carrier protein
VAVEHRGVVRLVRGTDYLTWVPGDRVAQASNASFDAATFEVWGALLNGAALVLVPRDTALLAGALAHAVAERRISVLFLTTALFNQVARERPDAFAPLRVLLFGGEAADPAAVRRVLAAGRPGHLLHVYGPTENTTFSTWHPVREVPANAETVPIGHALAGSSAWVADERLRPAGDDAEGELCLGGLGVARGYLGHPALTAERFVPDPFGEPGARLFRTGDRVRRGEGGALEFVGRLDGQVKIRGFRIEPGEVEAALRAHAQVGDAAVAAVEDARGEKRLVAYVVGRDGVRPGAAVLRRDLERRLPYFMVPTLCVLLDALPLSPNGKVDRRALPPPPARPADFEAPPVAPRTDVEAAVAAIWAEVLGLPEVGVDDDLFTLGAHSLAMTQVASRLRARLGVVLPLRELFGAPTVAALTGRYATMFALQARRFATVGADGEGGGDPAPEGEGSGGGDEEVRHG